MGKSNKDIGKLKSWVLASRPKTLPAAVSPILIGTSVAYYDDKLNIIAAIVALICSLLIQVGTNFVNDLYDHLKGSDSEERVGPERALATGMISVNEMKRVIYLTFVVTFLLGLYLVYIAGWPILLVGIFSIASGYAYTAGPYPLAYNGLGDIFVFVFFGVVAVVGTYYVQALQLTELIFVASIPAGTLITNILVVNNYRDIDEDRKNNKNTLAVKFGKQFSRIQYLVQMLIAYAVPVFVFINYDHSLAILLPLITLPIGIKLFRMLIILEGKALNKTLELTAKLSVIFSILFSIGFLL
ncbi:1,4-dihydroxy-2-naphthoate polyprenyltransferase [hydrothermal vent metagenome]|uniref:1,4-dihydroxy-2-naphthoate polyprenyltransferase n=1 Tax=hydrothermal vent metagenome TaxID=652676 RepID=A0A3B1CDN2_9ZZZZ